MRAALYARISETKDDHDSIATQEANLRALADREGYQIVGLYADDGISAYSGKPRPGWLRLKDDLKTRSFDVVLAVSEDRFARNSQEKIGFQGECVRSGVSWHTISGGKVDPASAGGALMGTITGAIAEYESGNKKERLRQRFDAETAEGKPLWGIRPFGFESARGGEVRESEAQHVRAAYRMILHGASLNSVQRSFNEAGVLTTRGNRWGYTTIRQLLLRPRNAGLLLSKGVIVGDGLPAIVSRDDFDAVIALLTNRSRDTSPGPKVTKHLMTGLAFCGVCGAPMRSASSRSRGRVLNIYKCASKITGVSVGDGVRHPTIQREILDDRMPYAVFEAMFLDGFYGFTTDGAASQLSPLRKELAEIERRRTHATSLMLEPDVALATVRAQLATLGVQAVKLTAEIEALLRSSAVSAVYAHMARLTKHLHIIQDGGRSATDFEFWERDALLDDFYADLMALSFEDKRALVRATVRIVVNPASSDRPRVEIGPANL